MTDDRNHVIRKSRDGFLYQDEYALFLFFDTLEKEKEGLKELYVDHPNGNRKSVDIILVFENGNQLIFEIKTGEDFAKNNKKELGLSLVSLYKFKENESNIKKYIIISLDQKRKQTYENLLKIEAIRKNRTLIFAGTDFTTDQLVDSLYSDLIESNKKILEEDKIEKSNFKEFIKTGFSYEHGESLYRANNDKSSSLESSIDKSIDDLFDRNLELAGNSLFFPSEVIRSQLLNVIRLNLGIEDNNIFPKIVNCLSDFFAKRVCIDSDKRKDGEIKQTSKDIQEKIFQLFKPKQILTETNIEEISGLEGQVIKK